MVVRMRVTKSHTGNRRSHHGLKEPRLAKCECGAFHQKHRACQECGMYRGRQVIDIVARKEREQKRASRREQELREAGMETSEQQQQQQAETQESSSDTANR